MEQGYPNEYRKTQYAQEVQSTFYRKDKVPLVAPPFAHVDSLNIIQQKMSKPNIIGAMWEATTMTPTHVRQLRRTIGSRGSKLHPSGHLVVFWHFHEQTSYKISAEKAQSKNYSEHMGKPGYLQIPDNLQQRTSTKYHQESENHAVERVLNIWAIAGTTISPVR